MFQGTMGCQYLHSFSTPSLKGSRPFLSEFPAVIPCLTPDPNAHLTGSELKRSKLSQYEISSLSIHVIFNFSIPPEASVMTSL